MQAVTLPLGRVREAGERTQVVLLVDALDESLASQAAKELPRLLGDVQDAHLVVTARPDRRATGSLWDRAVRVDLLADAPPDNDDVLEYLKHRLTSGGEPAAMAVLAQRMPVHAPTACTASGRNSIRRTSGGSTRSRCWTGSTTPMTGCCCG